MRVFCKQKGLKNSRNSGWATPSVLKSVRGFTLLELLVVMSLMSLLVLAMASAMRTTSQTSERVDVVLKRSDDLRIVSGFLRKILGRVSLQKRTSVFKEGVSQYYFDAAQTQITWLGVMPAGYGSGGRSLMRLLLQPAAVAEAGSDLVLQYIPWDQVPLEPDWTQAKSHVLLSSVREFQIGYQDARGEPPLWLPSWNSADAMPQRVRVSLSTVLGELPDLVISMRPLPASDPRSTGPIFGGSIR